MNPSLVPTAFMYLDRCRTSIPSYSGLQPKRRESKDHTARARNQQVYFLTQCKSGSASILVGWIRIRVHEGKIWPTKKAKKFLVFEMLDVLLWGLKASLVAWMSFIFFLPRNMILCIKIWFFTTIHTTIVQCVIIKFLDPDPHWPKIVGSALKPTRIPNTPYSAQSTFDIK